MEFDAAVFFSVARLLVILRASLIQVSARKNIKGESNWGCKGSKGKLPPCHANGKANFRASRGSQVTSARVDSSSFELLPT